MSSDTRGRAPRRGLLDRLVPGRLRRFGSRLARFVPAPLRRLIVRLLPETLRGRVVVLAVVASAVWIVILTAIFNVVFSAQLGEQARTMLQAQAEAVASTVDVGSDGTLTVHDAKNDAALDANTWIFQGATAIESPPKPTPWDADAARLADTGQRYIQTDGDDEAWIYALPIVDASGRQAGTVVIAAPVSVYDRTQELTLFGTAALGLLLLPGIAFVVSRAIGRALRPVEDMIDQADSWSRGGAVRRFGTGDRPEELERLAATLDRVLDRLAAAVRHERVLTAQVSHELRTPLAAVVAETSLLRSRPGLADDVAAALDEIAAGAERLTAIIDTLLRAAAVESNAGTLGRSRLLDAVSDAIAETELAPRARRSTATVEVTIDVPSDLWVGVDGPVVARMIAPLLDNARRYAQTRVAVTARATSESITVRVEDDGPGLDDVARSHAFEPGWRGSCDPEHGGGGLGLSLVRRLAHASGAEVAIEDRPAGDGASFRLDLPPAA